MPLKADEFQGGLARFTCLAPETLRHPASSIGNRIQPHATRSAPLARRDQHRSFQDAFFVSGISDRHGDFGIGDGAGPVDNHDHHAGAGCYQQPEHDHHNRFTGHVQRANHEHYHNPGPAIDSDHSNHRHHHKDQAPSQEGKDTHNHYDNPESFSKLVYHDHDDARASSVVASILSVRVRKIAPFAARPQVQYR